MDRLITATPLALVGRWSTRSQEQARRNAMAACTSLAARRLERLDVEAFVADCLARRATDRRATDRGAADRPGSLVGTG